MQEQQIAIKIKKAAGDNYEVVVNDVTVDKRLTMLWLFEETSPDKFFLSPEKVLPSESFNEMSNLDTFWGRQRIDKPMVTAALKVCLMTYNENLTEEDGREKINDDTWCVMQPDGETLYLGFRGTKPGSCSMVRVRLGL